MLPDKITSRFGALPLTIDVTLECGPLAVERVFDLQPGTVLRSLRSAGDNVDIHVGGRLVAYGEIVALEGMTGVRITNLRDVA